MSIFCTRPIVTSAHEEGGRITHIALIELMKEARLAFLNHHGMQEDNIAPNVGLVIGELSIRYCSPARASDPLKVSIDVDNVTEKRCTLTYDIRNIANHQLIANANTVIVFLNMKTEKPTSIPQNFLNILKENRPHCPNNPHRSRL